VRYPIEGVVSWNMNTTCNYRCSYCTQRFVDDRGQWARDLPAFLAAFAALPGDWEIKLSGGEPFRHPDFIATVAALAKARRRVSCASSPTRRARGRAWSRRRSTSSTPSPTRFSPSSPRSPHATPAAWSRRASPRARI
jgi:MoaA/NifB/PqqE/SkfB family radical SAM enzyme